MIGAMPGVLTLGPGTLLGEPFAAYNVRPPNVLSVEPQDAARPDGGAVVTVRVEVEGGEPYVEVLEVAESAAGVRARLAVLAAPPAGEGG